MEHFKCNATEHYSLHAGIAVRADDNKIYSMLLCLLNDTLGGLTFQYLSSDLEAL